MEAILNALTLTVDHFLWFAAGLVVGMVLRRWTKAREGGGDGAA